ncbi:DUF4271 domain-containing protein [Algoriphagus confluentis]|uniref:DUF4271 domain-containing protein n=1 Tax=Algoriphagus confluentis TaxID=1697556 RepID=A0ABQ6PL64_9BACT|nr:hypothetical protein Aconfl_05660 [Algoriphagus confluentis]
MGLIKQLFFGVLGFLWAFAGAQAQVLETYGVTPNSSEGGSWFNPKVAYEVELSASTYPLANFSIEAPAETTLFLEGRLWMATEKDTLIYISLRQMEEIVGKKEFLLTLFTPKAKGERIALKKVLNLPSTQVLSSGETTLGGPLPRLVYGPEIRDFYFVSLLIILFLVALYRLAYPYLLSALLQPVSVLSAEDFSDSGSLQKFFSFDILSYLFIVSMMVAQLALMVGVVFRPQQLTEQVGIEYSSLILVWIGGSALVFLLIVGKFVGIRLVSYFFDLGKVDFAHFFYLLRLIVLGVALVSAGIAFFVVNDFGRMSILLPYFIQGIFWVYLAAIFALFLIMMNRLSFKKYHLFTYLCIAELVPFLILSKWVSAWLF